MKLSLTELLPKKLVGGAFIRNVAIVATGTATTQAITMGFAPIITRMYGPEAFGVQGIFNSVMVLLSTISALGYPMAIVLPRSDADALTIGRLSIFICAIISALVALLVVFWGDVLLMYLNAEAIAPYAYFIPMAMVSSVVVGVLGQWLIRKKAFRISSMYGVANTFIINSGKAAVGLVAPTALALIAVNTLGQLFGVLLTYFGWRQSSQRNTQVNNDIASGQTVVHLAKKYADFPILRTPQNLINAFSQSLPVLLLASFFGAASAGQYSIALSVFGIPSALIAGSVMSVFYPRVTEAIHNGEDVRRLIIKATIGLAAAGALPFLLVLIAGPQLFEFVFGADWRTAGIYAQLLAVWLFFGFINKPSVAAIPALGLQGGLLLYEIFSTGSKVIALWLGFYLFKSDLLAIAGFSAVGIIAYVWLILWVIKESGRSKFHEKECSCF